MASRTNRLIAYSSKYQPRIAKGQHAAFSIQAQFVELNLDLGDLRNNPVEPAVAINSQQPHRRQVSQQPIAEFILSNRNGVEPQILKPFYP